MEGLAMGVKKTMMSYAAIVAGIAVPLALFEIVLDPFKTKRIWGGFCFGESMWWHELHIPILNRVAGDCMVTPYHLTVFFAFVPALCGAVIWTIYRNAIRGIVAKLSFLLACQLGVMVFEDALWFTFKGALPLLFHGQVAWFSKWITVFGMFEVPAFYVQLPAAIVILLAIEYFANRTVRPPELL